MIVPGIYRWDCLIQGRAGSSRRAKTRIEARTQKVVKLGTPVWVQCLLEIQSETAPELSILGGGPFHSGYVWGHHGSKPRRVIGLTRSSFWNECSGPIISCICRAFVVPTLKPFWGSWGIVRCVWVLDSHQPPDSKAGWGLTDAGLSRVEWLHIMYTWPPITNLWQVTMRRGPMGCDFAR